MKKVLAKYWFVFTLLLLGLTLWPLFLPGYFSHHDDLQVMRIFEMRKCIEDLQIPCRWVPDMGYGNGYPLFNYYSVFPYYLAAILSYIFGFLASAKLLFAIPLFLGAISMYLLAKELFGVYPAILASVLYTFAPYRSLDTYVRGAVAESFAMATIPLVFYFALKLTKLKSTKYLVGLSVSLAIFLVSHNIMILLFFPVLLIFILYQLVLEKWKNLSSLALGLILGIGLSSFFIFPAYFEKNLVQIDNLIRLDLNFRAHFVTVPQLLFDRSWGYGASSPGTNDTISFQIGWPHWWIVVAAFIMFLFSIIYKRKFNSLSLLLFMTFLFSIFMTHIKSAFIWEKIEVLKFTQFPWRFLSVAIFSSSLLGAYLVQNFKEVYKKYLSLILIILIIILNWNYFKPKEFYPSMTDQEKLSGKLWEDQQKAAILDYLPQTAVQPREAAPDKPIVVSGKGEVLKFENRSNKWQFQAKVEDKTSIEVPVFDFPIWEVKVNDQKMSFSNKNYLGRISINFERGGDYFVSGKFVDTTIRKISNVTSLVSLIILIGVVFYGKSKKRFN
ncbi:MAG: Uncharacterized protein G01um10147_73 [Microgenomates group bacterium Gr01-1014_7]|nr:MAG: Uncharacterized protein G01um10147_73 [Microgenomates group bacterium Gr01-1014_7]